MPSASIHDVLLGKAETIERSRLFVLMQAELEEADLVKSYFQPTRYRLSTYDVAGDRFRTDEATGRRGGPRERNIFAVPDELGSALSCEILLWPLFDGDDAS
jgi:hypothetical protein